MENNELNFDTLVATDAPDLSSIVSNEDKLSTLSQLGVFTSDAYMNSLPEEKSAEEVALDNAEAHKPTVQIDLNVDTENIILSRTELIRALRYAGVMIKKVTNDIEASSLNITYSDDGKVLYRLKDNMTYVTVEGTCKVSGEKPLIKTLSFNTTYLTKLLSAAAEDFLIFMDKATDAKGEEKDVIKARLINGDMILDVFEGNEAKLNAPGTKSEKINSVAGNVINTLCDVMIPLIADTQEVSSKRTIIYEDRAFFRSVTYLLQFRNEFSKMCLTKKELDLLKIVAGKVGTGNVDFYRVDSNGENRIMIVAPNVSISTSISVPNRDELIVGRFAELENAKYMKIDKNDFKRVLFLSGLGTNNVARVTMNYNIDGAGVDAKIIGRDGNSSFLISGNNYNNLEPRSEAVTIYAVQLSVLLKSFETGKDLEIAFLNSGVAFRDQTLGIEAIMNYSN